MLSKSESKVILGVINACGKRDSVLISPFDLIKLCLIKDLSVERLDKILSDLNSDGYFDLVHSERHGERIYCITLLDKGKGYDRSVKVLRRSVLFRIGLSTALAVFSFLIGVILRRIF